MAYRNIFIESNIRISTKNEQLILQKETNCSIPLEDINTILIENMHTIISTYCFNKFSEYGIAVYFCNSKHIPSCVVLPLLNHSRHFKMLKMQLDISKPLQKKLWQQIIKQKIMNQAICYKLLGSDDNYLYSLEKTVLSGDSTNVEAIAAVYYFKAIYGFSFKRRNDSFINSALNYGYAIIRGMICRSIVVHGLEPSIGLFHHSELNSFNLADDFIEPLRPFVDYYITQKLEIQEKEVLESSDKRKIFEMLSFCIENNEQEHSIANAIEIMICSYIKVLNQDSKNLCLPKLIELKQYEYK